MIQSIKINLNKTTFTLDNNAYEKLNAYMFELKNSFKNDSDIVFDIEARLAELLTLQLAATNVEVVNESHVTNALNTIGSVQELLKSYNIETGNSNNFTNNNFNNNEKPLLRRNPFNQSLGGVCSGIANYLNTDTSLVRIAFVFAFFIIGSGLLIYLILWIVIPKATGELAGKLNKRENNNPNKLYRSKENKAIGGVCSALALHFGLEIWVIRLAFFIGLFLYGSTFILYIISWIVIPKASNNTYNNNSNYSNQPSSQNDENVKGIRNLFKVIIFAIAIFIIGIFITSAFFTAGLMSVFIDNNMYDFIINSFPLNENLNLIITGIFICVLTPVLFILALLSKFIFNANFSFKYAGSGLTLLFFIGVGLLIYSGINGIPKYINQEENTLIENKNFIQKDSLKIIVDEVKVGNKINLFKYNDFEIHFCDSGVFVPIEYNITKTLEDTASISITKKVIANDDDENVFDNLIFNYVHNDNSFHLPSHYFIPKGKKFKFQTVKVKLFLKENKTIYLNETAQSILGIINKSQTPSKFWFNTNNIENLIDNNSSDWDDKTEKKEVEMERKIEEKEAEIERKIEEIERKKEELERKANNL